MTRSLFLLPCLLATTSTLLFVASLHHTRKHPLFTHVLHRWCYSSVVPEGTSPLLIGASNHEQQKERQQQQLDRQKEELGPANLDSHLSDTLDPTRFTLDPDAHIYSRLTEATPSDILPRPPDPACPRALAGPLGHASSDGLGHRITLVIYELNLAAGIRVGYWHRVSPYGSLTRSDRLAVQRLFGWNLWGQERDRLLQRHCAIVSRSSEACPNTASDVHPACEALRPRSPYKKIVHVPKPLVDCFLDSNTTHAECEIRLREFGKQYPACGTLFQARPSRCSFDYRDGDVNRVNPWLRIHYWNAHRSSTILVHPKELLRGENISTGPKDATKRRPFPAGAGETALPEEVMIVSKDVTRILPFRADRLQVVVHVRRGDFFIYKNHILIPDALYAAVVSRVVAAVRDVLGQKVGIDVGVYSEGAPAPGHKLRGSSHDTTTMSGVYVTETGAHVINATKYWRSIISDALEVTSSPVNVTNDGKSNGGYSPEKESSISRVSTKDESGDDPNVRVFAFISTDTIATVHAINCADVVVASFSGLTGIIATRIGRGLILLPRKSKERRDKVEERKFWYGVGDAVGTDDGWFNTDNLRKGLSDMFPHGRINPQKVS